MSGPAGAPAALARRVCPELPVGLEKKPGESKLEGLRRYLELVDRAIKRFEKLLRRFVRPWIRL